MHKNIKNLIEIDNKVKLKLQSLNFENKTKIIAVSKTFKTEQILPLIEHGHLHFGENKVQEAMEKWTKIKNTFENIKLHMIGKLQTNKVKFAVSLFDYIHSLDSEKLANKISIEQKNVKKNLKIFIQVNIGDEEQKSGIDLENLKEFYDMCIKKYDLNIIGLMCIPPQNKPVKIYFEKMKILKNSLKIKELSMGMSSDYLEAIEYGSTFVRVGSKIFGERI